MVKRAKLIPDKDVGRWCYADSEFHASRNRPGVYLGVDDSGLANFGYDGWISTCSTARIKFITHEEAMERIKAYEERMEKARWLRIDSMGEKLVRDFTELHNRPPQVEPAFLRLAAEAVVNEKEIR